MAATPDGAVLAAQTLHRATNLDDTESEHVQTNEAWAAQARDALTARLAEHLATATQQPASRLTEQDSTLIWMWRHTAPAGIRSWLRNRLDNGWELLPLLAALITPKQFPFPLLDPATLAGLDAMFTLDALYTHLAPPPRKPARSTTHRSTPPEPCSHPRPARTGTAT
ncbi:hypothetical protein ACGFZQ_50020 [Streptomyces sp. NPDC048254]|uniref:hypothetical protein n=1 Tax=Streptomyces sp. NPDC048254 TaxID=3365525 RepID=UPI003712B697